MSRVALLASLLMGTAVIVATGAHGDEVDKPSASTNYDGAIFQKRAPSDQLAFLSQFAGVPVSDAFRDKQFRKQMHSLLPDCIFHYGSDMPLTKAVEMVLEQSTQPVNVRAGRYVTLAGGGGPYLRGRGFLWFDIQDGIALGGFYFHPTNGEPTPSVTVFSRQVKEDDVLALSQLPPAFVEELGHWSESSGVPPITTRYFITGGNRKILLEHDENYCALAGPASGGLDPACINMSASAADIDLNAAYYLDQTHHATNATAWMITGADQVAWIQIRDNTCRFGPNPLGCRIRMTHERVHVIVRRNTVGRNAAPGAVR